MKMNDYQNISIQAHNKPQIDHLPPPISLKSQTQAHPVLFPSLNSIPASSTAITQNNGNNININENNNYNYRKPKSSSSRRNKYNITSNDPILSIANNINGNPGEDCLFTLQPNSKITSITLLTRGLKLLSIFHLRQLLRDYSLPTGGNKQALVDRLIIFLETFGPTQQAMLVQFSVNLKKLLSVDGAEQEEAQTEESPMQLLPPGISGQIFETSPSCLLATTNQHLAFGPVMIQAKTPSEQFEFTLLNPPPNCIPILQFAPVFLDSPLKTISFQLGNTFLSLSDPVLWFPVTEFINKSGLFQVKQTEPSVPVIAVVRWMKKIPINVVEEIIRKRPPPPQMFPVQQNQNQASNTNDADSKYFNDGKMTGICPLTRKIITQPARGVKCKHGECFDLTGFLCSAAKMNMWMCPICTKPLNAEDLRIDCNYFLYVK